MSTFVRRRMALAATALSAFTLTAVNYAADPGAPVSNEVRVNGTTLATQSGAAVARAPGGGFAVAWAGNGDGDPDGVFVRRFDLMGVPLAAELRVNVQTTGIQRNPSIAMATDGSFVVAFDGDGADGAGTGVVAQRFDASGAAAGAPIAVNTFTTGDQKAPSVAVSATGGFVIAWQSLDQDGSGQGIFARRFDASGAPLGGEFGVNTYTTLSQSDPSVAMDLAGNFVVAWQSNRQEGPTSSNGIYARRYGSDGAALGAEFHVNTVAAGEQTAPSIGLSAAGVFATWQTTDADGTGIAARRFDVGGTPLGDEFAVNTTATGDQRNPAVAVDALGSVVVAWQGPDASGTGVYAQRYDIAGDAVGAQQTVNATTIDTQQRPSVAVDADGDAVVAWESRLQDTSDLGVYARRFAGAEDVDLAITKRDNIDTVVAATGQLDYTITVTNLNAASTPTGNSAVDGEVGVASGVVVTDTLPAGVSTATGTGAGWTCAAANGVLTCRRDTLQPGQIRTIQVTAAAPATQAELVNQVSVTADQPDASAANNSAQASTAVCIGVAEPGQLQFATATQSVGEAGPVATISVSRTGGACGAVSVQVATTAGTALAGPDFTPGSGTLNWADADAAPKSFTVPIVQDTIDENNENFTVTLSNPQRAALGATTTKTVTITDDDAEPTVSFSPATANVVEGAAGDHTTITATVQLSAASGRTITVPFTVGGTATAGGKDHNAEAGSIVLQPGQTSGSTTYDVVDDALDENDETVTLTMGTPTRASAGANPVHTTTIVDDDATPTVQFTAAGSEANENGGTLQIAVQLSAPSGRPVTVSYAASGNASAGSDYSIAASPLTIPVESTSASIAVTLTDDALDEADEEIDVTLTGATQATLGDAVLHTLTILDNEAQPTVQFTSAAQTVGESTASATATLSLSAVSGRSVTVTLAPSGSAQSGGVDYAFSPSPTVTIPAGQTSAQVTLSIVNDTLDEINEKGILTIDSVTHGAAGDTKVHTLTITDNDTPPSVTLANAAQTVAEDVEGGTANIVLQLSKASGRDVAVPFSLGGTAANGVDYTLAASPAVIPAGATQLSVPVSIVNDVIDEPSETMSFTIAAPSDGSATLGATTSHVLTLTDNDATPQISFTASAQGRDEGDGTATVSIVLSRPSSEDINVVYAVSGTASEGDYVLPEEPPVIVAGATSASFQVGLVQDAADEPSETLVLTLQPTDNATPAAPGKHTITIADDDAQPQVAFASASQDVVEGDGGDVVVTVTAEVTTPSGFDVDVPFTVSGSATGSGVDHDATDGTIVIPAGAPNASATFAVKADTLDEEDESVVFAMGVPSHAQSGGVTIHTVTLQDAVGDVPPDVTLDALGTLKEGIADPATVTAHLATASGKPVTVSLAFGGTAQSPGDYSASASEIPIAAGETSGFITLSAVDDALDENQERVSVEIAGAVNAVESTAQSATVFINDNDPRPTVQFKVSGVTITEGNGGSKTVTAMLVLSAPSGRAVTVPYTVGGTATPGSDHTAQDGSVRFSVGATSRKITFDVLGDTAHESAETVVLTLGTPVNADVGGTATHTTTITDND